MSTDVDDFLAHFGVKGMRWGVRRDRGPDGTVSGGKGSIVKRQPDSEEHTVSRQLKSRSVSSLSNKELQTLVNRMNLEAQYSKLSPSVKSSGLDFVKKTLGNAAKTTIQNMLAEAIKTGAQKLVEVLMEQLKSK